MKSDFVIVKKSNIHNKGVFASRNFKKGEIVLHWDISNIITKDEYNKLSSEETDHIPILNGKYIIIQDPEKYVNHSCDANTISENFCDIAVRDIKKGDEITTDYSKDPPETEMICNCGSLKCKRMIKNKCPKMELLRHFVPRPRLAGSRSTPFRSPSPNTEYVEKGSARLFPKFAFLR